MPDTRRVRERGIMPVNGFSVPCGVSIVMVSPTLTASCFARSCPRKMPSWLVLVSRIRDRSACPDTIDFSISVTDASSAGSMPLKLMKASLLGEDASARPIIAGAAPTTRGTLRSASISGLIVLDAGRLEHEDVGGRAENPVAQLALQAGHQRERDDERHHADG